MADARVCAHTRTHTDVRLLQGNSLMTSIISSDLIICSYHVPYSPQRKSRFSRQVLKAEKVSSPPILTPNMSLMMTFQPGA